MSGFDEAVAQARALNAEILDEPHVNPRQITENTMVTS